jgi:hypothetical protein
MGQSITAMDDSEIEQELEALTAVQVNVSLCLFAIKKRVSAKYMYAGYYSFLPCCADT